MKINHIIIKPILTEKATDLAAKKIYLFHVAKNANKFQIKEAVEKTYSVKIQSVHIINRQGKKKRVGRKMITKTMPAKKIALITVKTGKISLFPEA